MLTAALVAAVLVWVRVTLPPQRLTLAKAGDGTIAGLLHIHTNRSDGLSSPDEVAAAAARAGLKFIVTRSQGKICHWDSRDAIALREKRLMVPVSVPVG